MKRTIFVKPNKKTANRWIAIYTGLRLLAKPVSSVTLTETKEHIILTCSSNSLQLCALRENLTLDALLKLGRALELSEEQASQAEKVAADVNATETEGSNGPGRSRQRNEHSSLSRFRRSQSNNRQNSNKRNKQARKMW